MVAAALYFDPKSLSNSTSAPDPQSSTRNRAPAEKKSAVFGGKIDAHVGLEVLFFFFPFTVPWCRQRQKINFLGLVIGASS